MRKIFLFFLTFISFMFLGCSTRCQTSCCSQGYTVKYPEPYYYESDCGKRVYVPSFYDSCGYCY